MFSYLFGKTIDAALEFFANFEAMIEEKTYDEEMLNEAIVYEDIYKQSNRKTCALLPYTGIKKALLDYKN